MVGGRVQLSVAVAVPVFAGSELALHEMARLAGQKMMMGATMSAMTVLLQTLVHPLELVTVTV